MFSRDLVSYGSPAAALLLSPLMIGVITRTKALFAGKQGAPLLQPYYDIVKLLRKGAVYSKTTTAVFRIGPVLGVAVVALCSLLLPLGANRAAVSFPADIVVFVYLLGLMRFFTIVAALDTGSAFEGMGASREAFFSMIAEPVLFLGLCALVRESGSLTLSGVIGSTVSSAVVPSMLVGFGLFAIILAENARIPVDDPTTHLELTMIHEVMVLDHSGPDFAMITYASSVKLWLFCALVMQIFLPFARQEGLAGVALVTALVFACAVGIGVVESTMARVRLLKVPQLLIGSGALVMLAFLFAVLGEYL